MNYGASPRRSPRQDVIDVRNGVRAAEPLAEKLIGWNRSAAMLEGRLRHAERHGAQLADLLPEIEQLTESIESSLDLWRHTLPGKDASGRVEDAERASRSLLGTLAALRARAYAST